MIKLEQIQEIFNKHFSAPFLEEGHVKTHFIEHAKEKTLEIKIGRRDIWLNEKGEVTGAGTNVAQCAS